MSTKQKTNSLEFELSDDGRLIRIYQTESAGCVMTTHGCTALPKRTMIAWLEKWHGQVRFFPSHERSFRSHLGAMSVDQLKLITHVMETDGENLTDIFI